MSKPVLLYIHGFMSSGTTLKGRALAHRYADRFNVRLPSWPQASPLAGRDFLLEQIEGVDKGVLVGSSLGGFYAQHLGHRLGWPVVLINPALDMRCVTGQLRGEHVNPFTGERVVVDERWLDELSQLRSEPVRPALVLLCADDDVVRPDCALDTYRGVGQVVLMPDGGHACWPLDPLWSCLDGFLGQYVQ